MRPLSLLISGWMCLCTSGLMCAVTPCSRIHLDAPVTINDTAVSRQLVSAVSDSLCSIEVEARGALSKVKERRGLSKNHWGLTLLAPGDTVRISLRFGNTDYGDMLDRRIATLSVTRNGSSLFDKEVAGFRMSSNELNSLNATFTDHQLTVSGGGEQCRELAKVDIAGFSPHEAQVWSVGQLLLTIFSTETCTPPSIALASGYTFEELKERFRTARDPLEGFWTYFDRSNDPQRARLGGQYTLAVVKKQQSEHEASTSGADMAQPTSDSFIFDNYDIIYVSGAVTLADTWQPMMLKGALRSTIFDGHYDLEWIDSTMQPMTTDLHATLDYSQGAYGDGTSASVPAGSVSLTGSMLTLNFPLLKTTIRFSKLPMSVR